MGEWEGEVCGYGEEGVGWDGWVEEGYGVINFFFGVPLKEVEGGVAALAFVLTFMIPLTRCWQDII